MSMFANTLAVVFAGERGRALGSLTTDRAKAAVPFGGEYRIIDFALSNCLHSGLRRIYVLTQFHAHSLHEHLRSGWNVFNSELDEFVTAVPPQLRDGERWYSGSAQAIADNLFLIQRSGASRVLLINGGYIYRMDYAAMLDTHDTRKARVTVGYLQSPAGRHPALDRFSLDDKQRLVGYHPRRRGSEGDDDADDTVNASIGAMVVNVDLLTSLLHRDAGDTFNGVSLAEHLLPHLMEESRVYGYRFGGRKGRVSQDRFFSPVAEVDEYMQANMTLLEPVPPLDLYQRDWPIWSQSRRLPPARTVGSRQGNEGIFVNSIVSNGTIIEGGAVSHSVICPRVRVRDSAAVERCILFDDVEVGEGCELRNCIIDKYAQVPAGERIGFDLERDRERFEVTARGVVVVPKGYGVSKA
jgi:glucose-1-phosphate adenylyltransferase